MMALGSRKVGCRMSFADSEDLLTKEIIGLAIAVHRELGPGLLESVYEYFLAYELNKAGLKVLRQPTLPVTYGGVRFDLGFRPDLIVNDVVIIEIKTVQKLLPVHSAQLLTYLKLSSIQRGLLMNFHAHPLREGLKRLVRTEDHRPKAL